MERDPEVPLKLFHVFEERRILAAGRGVREAFKVLVLSTNLETLCGCAL